MTDILTDEAEDEIDWHGAPVPPPGVPEVPVICEITDTYQELSFRCPFCDQPHYVTSPHGGYGLQQSNCWQGEYFLRDPRPGETVDLVSYRSRKTVPYDGVANPAGFNPKDLAEVLARQKRNRIEAYVEDYREWLADPMGQPAPPGAAEAIEHLKWESFQLRRQFGDEDAAYESVYGEQADPEPEPELTPAEQARADELWAHVAAELRKETWQHLTNEIPPEIEMYDTTPAELTDDERVDRAHSNDPVVVHSDASMMERCALYLKRHHTWEKLPTLRRYRGEFYVWHGTHYESLTDEAVRSALYTFFEKASISKNATLFPYKPDQPGISKLFDALKAACVLRDRVDNPGWTDDRDGPEPGDLVAFSNGLLDITARQMLPLTPAFFNLNALPFTFVPDANAPVHWLQFLEDIWSNDRQSIELLQEWFGVLLTTDTRYQKILLMIGPPRSGKGTIIRVLTAMLGQHNCCGPTLNSIGGTFGLAPLIGKTSAVISDARMTGKTDQGVVVERLLSISGEDSLSVDRKHIDSWEGKLSTRITILSNELPWLADSSSALANRFIVLRQTRSWLGNEDQGLTGRLLAEMAGIVRWSLAGLDRLRKRGRFVQPESANVLVREMHDMGSPISAFLRDRCETGTDLTVPKADLFSAWSVYCSGKGMRAGNDADFGRKLRAALPSLGEARPRDKDNRTRVYTGLKLIPGEWEFDCE